MSLQAGNLCTRSVSFQVPEATVDILFIFSLELFRKILLARVKLKAPQIFHAMDQDLRHPVPESFFTRFPWREYFWNIHRGGGMAV